MIAQTYLSDNGKSLIDLTDRTIKEGMSEAMYAGLGYQGRKIYHIKRTTCIVGEREVRICGEKPEDVGLAHSFLEKKLEKFGIKLVEIK
jgi:hypothetical protein